MQSTNPPRGGPLPQSRFGVVLVEPLYPDNVGHVARALLNFGVGDLFIVNSMLSPGAEQVARERAVHAQDVLNHARHVASLDDVRPHFELIVGFAARISGLDKAHLRMSEPLERVARRLDETQGRIALVFGREDFGLSNEDVEKCDLLCTIPTAPSYRSMNLSHAVTVALYEMTRRDHAPLPYLSMATQHEKNVLFTTWTHLNRDLGFKEHRVEQFDVMIRRVLGRAALTSWEYHRLMGTLSRALKRLGAWPPPVPVPDDVAEDDADEDAAPQPQ